MVKQTTHCRYHASPVGYFDTIFPYATVTLVGPNSAWLWSAISGIALVLSLLAIYRQVSMQRSSNAIQQVTNLRVEYNSELWVGERIECINQLLSDEPVTLHSTSVWAVAEYFDNIGTLARKRHLDRTLLYSLLGGNAVSWWAILTPTFDDLNIQESAPGYIDDFKWLVTDILKRREGKGTVAGASSTTITPEYLREMRDGLRKRLAFLESFRK